MPKLFISYSRVNLEIVQKLRQDLQYAGIDIWIDQVGLIPGTPDWDQALRDAVRGASAILLVASPDSRRSLYVRDEIAIAKDSKKPIYPLWVDGDNWIDCVPLGLGSTQNVDLRGISYAKNLPSLIEALNGRPTDIEPVKEPPTETLPQVANPRNPYKGLKSFKTNDSQDFFGRAELTENLVSLIDENSRQARFLAILGPSGSGKSSVMMAGVLPKLREEKPDLILLDTIVPGTDPLANLTITLARHLSEKTMHSIREDLDSHTTTGLDMLARQISDEAVVLYIDQFEELFTLVPDKTAQRHFIDLLVNATTNSDGVLFVLLSMRADFYDGPANYPAFAALMEKHHALMTPMSLADLYDVVKLPAQLSDVGLSFDEDLVTEMVFAVREEDGALPLLQFTLEQLFDQRDGNRLTMSAYREMGGVQGALAKHAENTYQKLPSDQHRELARAMFMRLIEPGQSTNDTTRRRATYQELTLTDAEQTTIMREVMEEFIKSRLLIASLVYNEKMLEVSHEALIRKWERLGEWLNAARADLRIQKALTTDVADWNVRGKPEDKLYRGIVLEEAIEWSERNLANREETIFLEMSTKHEAERIAREKRNRRLVQISTGGLVAAVVIGSIVLALIFAMNNAELEAEALTLEANAEIALNNANSAATDAGNAVAIAATAQADANEAQSAADIAEEQALTLQADAATSLADANLSDEQAGTAQAEANIASTDAQISGDNAATSQVDAFLSNIQAATAQGEADLASTDVALLADEAATVAAQADIANTDVAESNVIATNQAIAVATALAAQSIADTNLTAAANEMNLAGTEISGINAQATSVREALRDASIQVTGALEVIETADAVAAGTSTAIAENLQTQQALLDATNTAVALQQTQAFEIGLTETTVFILSLTPTPTDTPPATNTPEVVDTDLDGFADEVDECPFESGSVNGCPDADGDGVIDAFDVCPNEFGDTTTGCPATPVPVARPNGGELTILYWQAASTLNPYLSGGTKDVDASALVLEPLANFDSSGNLVPVLAEFIPTVENGGISQDLTTITWILQEGIVWSDGTPFTSNDVVFTWEHCTNPDTGCAFFNNFDDVVRVDAIDDLTVVITFDVPKPFPYLPFVSQDSPILNANQFAGCVGASAVNCTQQNFAPIGTGPFVVDTFSANDFVNYVRNENYRDPAKPYFESVRLIGGGDAESAARAVLETGEADYAWNLQISPDVLSFMEAAGNGQVVVAFGSNVERLLLNQTNPSSNLGTSQRSIWFADGSNEHPFLTIPAMSRAMSLAIDRNIIADQLYGYAGVVACNIVNGPPINVSQTYLGCSQDIEFANALLDEAGIVDTDGDGIREYNGIPLTITYQTSTNAVRQSTQALIKQWWSEIGIDTELRNIDAAVFFGGDPASPDTYQKFYSDVEMFTSGTAGPDAEDFLGRWICDSTPGPENSWFASNIPRYCDPAYDALYVELTQTSGIEARAAIVREMNDLLIESGAMIPLVHRSSISAHANSLTGIDMNAWDSELWNIEDWARQ